MQGYVSNSFEHPPNVGTQKLHEILRRQWCPSHFETYNVHCTQSIVKRNWSISMEQYEENLAKNTWISTISSSVQTTHRKEQLFNLVYATPIGKNWQYSWHIKLKLAMWLQPKHMKEQVCNMLGAAHKAIIFKNKETWLS